MKKIFYFVLLCSVLLGVNAAQAAVLNFDDIDTGPIPSGYGGFNWSNMYALNGSTYENSGYKNGVVSVTNVAYNAWGDMGIISANPFTFIGAYFTAAWNDGLTIVATGSRNNVDLFSKSYSVDTSSPTWLAFNFSDIDKLTLTSSGGIHHGYDGSGTHFAMDNFTYNEQTNAVPVPAAAWLFGSAIMGLSGFARRKSSTLLADA